MSTATSAQATVQNVQARRRQPFITDAYYESMVEFLDTSEAFWSVQQLDEDAVGQGECLKARNIIVDQFAALMLRYTAGEPVPSLIPYLEKLIDAYERHQRALAAYEGDADASPLCLSDLCDYEECLQVVSFCVLLRQDALLARFVRMIDAGGYASEDVLYEDLLHKVLPGRFNVDSFYHFIYGALIESVYAPCAEDAARLLNEYCTHWYSGFKDAQTAWHDTHLDMTEDDGAYFGYWALEAAAIAYLYGIDDSAITHMVYPRDLVEHARALAPISPV